MSPRDNGRFCIEFRTFHFRQSVIKKAGPLDEEELNFKVLNDIEFIKYLSIRDVIYP